MPFGIVAYALMFFSWTTFVETAVNLHAMLQYTVMHMNRYENDVLFSKDTGMCILQNRYVFRKVYNLESCHL